MIKVRISTLQSGKVDSELKIENFETVESAFIRALANVPEDPRFSKEEIFHVLVNGKKIEKEMFHFTRLVDTDEVLICPIIRGGDNNATFRQIAMLGVAAVVGFYFPPAAFAPLGFTGVAAAIASAGTVMLGALAVNALIPPSSQSINVDSPQSQSQMYFISNQSNSVSKFGFVPKVYGTHKMFPKVAANPYTELEIDESTGQLAQFLYCVYDFGFGPNVIEDIRIGGTPISQFDDVKYRLVDFNKPLVNEGIWDTQLERDLIWYKGDVASLDVAVALNGNQFIDGGGDPTLYQATRNVPLNLRDEKQEISLSFTFPQGLYSRNADGILGDRLVDVFVEFREAGSVDDSAWKGFNDYDHVDSWSIVGGDQALFNLGLELFPFKIGDSILNPGWEAYEDPDPTPYVNLYTGESRRHSRSQYEGPNQTGAVITGRYREVGIAAGATNVVVKANSALFVGGPLRHNNQLLGYIDSIVPYAPNPAYVTLNIDRALPEITLFEYILRKDWDGVFSTHYPIDLKLTGKLESASNSEGLARFARRSINPTAAVLKFTPKVVEDYEVRVTRFNSTSNPTTYTSLKVDAMTWTALSTRFDTQPIVTDKRHTFLEMKIRATGQLNGSVSDLSAVVTSVLDTYDEDTDTWIKIPTNNPAWVYVDLLTGEVNKRPISKDKLHLDSILEWRDFCDQIPTSPDPLVPYNFPRFQTNFVLDYSTTLQEILIQVCSAGQASLNIVDAKYGVLVDKLRTVPVQIFTPRNSRDFSSSRSYPTRPHALKVQYVDPTLSWEVAEEIVYEDGYSAGNAEKFDELVCFGATNDEQAWRYGRYMLFQNRLRQETISIVVDFEHLVCTRGDYVQFVQDTMRVGGVAGRVKTVAGNEITIDNSVEIIPSEDYGYSYRGADGVIHSGTLTPIDGRTFELDGSIPDVGDLFVVGVVGSVVYDCIVKSISPNDDMSATLILVEKADEIYDAESTGDFPEYDPRLSQTSSPDLSPPGPVEALVVADTGYECDSGRYSYYVLIDWEPPTGAAPENYEVYVNFGDGYDLWDITKESFYKYEVATANLGKEHTFKVLAVSSSGKKINVRVASEISATVDENLVEPAEVTSFRADMTAGVLQFTWDKSPNCDIDYYVIKHSPIPITDPLIYPLEDMWKKGVPIVRAPNTATVASVQSRGGTYMIKAVRFNGVESDTFPVFYVEYDSDVDRAIRWGNVIFDPSAPGDVTLVNMDFDPVEDCWQLSQRVVSSDPDVREYFEEGFMYMNFPTGIASQLRLFKLVASINIWDVIPNDLSSDFDVEMQYLIADDTGFMSDWVTMDEVDPINEYDYVGASTYKTLLARNEIAKILGARIRVRTRKVTITPRIKVCRITIDEERRVLEYENQTAPSSGWSTVTYNNAFSDAAPHPSVQITVQNPESGDYYEFGSLTNAGFEIRFFDSTDTQVSRVYSATVNGFGKLY